MRLLLSGPFFFGRQGENGGAGERGHVSVAREKVELCGTGVTEELL